MTWGGGLKCEFIDKVFKAKRRKKLVGMFLRNLFIFVCKNDKDGGGGFCESKNAIGG